MRLSNVIVGSLFLCAAAGRRAAADEPSRPEARPPIPPGAVAVLNGRPVAIEDYKEFLYQTVGTSLLLDFLDRVLVEEEARRLAVSVPYERLEEETRKEIERRSAPFQKSRAKYIAALEERGGSWKEEEESIRADVLRRLILEQCVVRTRQVGEEDAQRGFQELFGEDARSGKVAFEQVKDEVVRNLKERPPTEEEKKAYLRGLRERAKVQMKSVGEPAPEPPPKEPTPPAKAPAPPRKRSPGLGPPWKARV